MSNSRGFRRVLPNMPHGAPGRGGVRPKHHPPVFHVLVVLTLVAPLPFGAYADWAWGGIAAVSGALVFCWGITTLAGSAQFVRPPPFLWWSAAALAVTMSWALLQSAGFTPENLHHPIWRNTTEALAVPYRGAISLDPAASRESILRVAAYAGVFWLAFQYGCDPERAWYAVRVLGAGATCYALYGLAVVFSGAESIFWFKKTAYYDAVTATFVNPNSFATWCGIGLLCVTAVLRRRVELVEPYRAANFKLKLYFLIAEYLPRNVLWLAAWLMLGSALLLSLSRGAAMATFLALLAFLWLLAARRGLRPRILALRFIGLILASGGLLLLAGGSLEQALWKIGPDWAKREEIYSLTLKAIEERPLLGTGLDTFASVYRSHRSAEIRPGVTMAHNDYLELALELGIPAALLFVFAVFVLALGCAWGVLTRRQNFVLPALGVATCTLVGAHSLIDFSLQIPAVAVMFSLILGVAVAQAQQFGTGPLQAWTGKGAAE